MRVMDRRGPAQATVTDVADALGISRRTVYNYFASTEQLFTAVAELALQGFVADVKSIIADLDVTAQLVEVVAYIIERLPREPQFALLLANDRSNTLSRNMLASSEIARSREFSDRPTSPGQPSVTTTAPSTNSSSSYCASSSRGSSRHQKHRVRAPNSATTAPLGRTSHLLARARTGAQRSNRTRRRADRMWGHHRPSRRSSSLWHPCASTPGFRPV